MNFVDQLNRLVLNRIRSPKLRPLLVGDGISQGTQLYRLPDLVGILAYETDVLEGLVIALALTFLDGTTMVMTQEDSCWSDLLSALDRLALTAVCSAEWLTALVGGEGHEHAIVLRGGSATPAPLSPSRMR